MYITDFYLEYEVQEDDLNIIRFQNYFCARDNNISNCDPEKRNKMDVAVKIKLND